MRTKVLHVMISNTSFETINSDPEKSLSPFGILQSSQDFLSLETVAVMLPQASCNRMASFFRGLYSCFSLARIDFLICVNRFKVKTLLRTHE